MIDRERIEQEATHFFEWPDPENKDYVTLTSCVLFAHAIAEMARSEDRKAHENALSVALADAQRLREWLSGDAECPCCGGITECSDGCTFSTDDRDSAARMKWVRHVLAGA